MSTALLRPAQPTDAGRVGAILSAFIDDTIWMPRIHTRAEDLSFAGHMVDQGWVSVACIEERVEGFIARDAAMIHALYLDVGIQRRGVGSQLLNAAKAAHPSLTLWTFQANTGAQAFYLANDFREIARSDGAGNDEGLPDIQYEWVKERM